MVNVINGIHTGYLPALTKSYDGIQSTIWFDCKEMKKDENVFRFCFNDFQNVIFFTDNVKLQI